MAPSLTSAAAETASEVNVADFVSEKLQNSNNYKLWRKQMLRFLESQGLAGIPPPPPTEEQQYAAWSRANRLVKAWLLESLSDEVAQTVENFGTASDMWLHLKNNFSHYSKDFVSEKLQNSKNYKSWREQMLRFMENQGLAGLPPPPPTEVQHYAAWRQTDSLLKAWLLESVSNEVAQTVANFGTASDMWLHLENNFSHYSKAAETASEVNVGDFVSEKLQNSNNYESWREQMLRFMESQGLAGRPPQPAPTEEQHYVAWRQTDSLLKAWLLESVSDEVAQTVENSGTASDMWLHLENNFYHYSKGKEWHEYLPLYKAAVRGDWETVKAILEHDPGAVDARVAFVTLETALHVAVSSGKSARFVARLVKCMSNEALAIADRMGFNALHTAALTGNLPAAKILTYRLPALLYEPCNAGRFPVHWAAVWVADWDADVAHRRTLDFLISRTRHYSTDDLNNPFASNSVLLLFSYMLDADYFDMALDLVDKNPELARFNSEVHGSALMMITGKDTTFSDAHFNWWERLIYNSLPQQQLPTLCNLIKRLVPRVKGIHEKKLKRDLALKLVKRLCKHMEWLTHEEAADIYTVPFLAAARLGNHEIIEEVVDTFPTAIYSTDPATKQLFIHLAVQNRCERVFNLMYQTGNHRYQYANRGDSNGNTILHLAAALAPPHKLNLVSGAALQMQREIQWFKEADKFISPYYRERQNNAGKTPKMIFTEEHRELKEEGEKWMKDTATSCTIAAALIVTIVFAAAITVPGGNESDSGFPMMWKSIAFTIFAVSDAISLFTSTTSLLMFLSILTSRYAEEDFLYALPKRLCIGLVTLFLSILFMMVAFGSTLYLVFGRMHTWILVPVVALSLLPISSFVLLQFPLLIDVVSSTYGRGIFGNQSHRPFH